MTYFVRGVIINNAAAEGRPAVKSVIARDTPRQAMAPLMATPLTSPTTGWWVRPDAEQRAENRQRMIDETIEDFIYYGGIAIGLLFGNYASKLYAFLVLIGEKDPIYEGQ